MICDDCNRLSPCHYAVVTTGEGYEAKTQYGPSEFLIPLCVNCGESWCRHHWSNANEECCNRAIKIFLSKIQDGEIIPKYG